MSSAGAMKKRPFINIISERTRRAAPLLPDMPVTHLHASLPFSSLSPATRSVSSAGPLVGPANANFTCGKFPPLKPTLADA